MRKPTLLLLAATLSILGANLASAEKVYTWRDANGVIHFGDRPTSDNARQIAVKTNAPSVPVASDNDEAGSSDPAVQSSTSSDEDDDAKQQSPADKRRAERAAAEEKRRACDSSRARLTRLVGASRMYRKTADGGRDYFSEEEIAKARAEAEQAVKDNCTE